MKVSQTYHQALGTLDHLDFYSQVTSFISEQLKGLRLCFLLLTLGSNTLSSIKYNHQKKGEEKKKSALRGKPEMCQKHFQSKIETK